MKFIIFFFLIAFSEVTSLKLKAASNKVALSLATKKHHKSRALVSLPENDLITKLKEKFNQWGTNAENSKIFNFFLGALLKAFSLLEGNEILEIIKCVVSSIEVFYNSHKFPEKSLKELQAEKKLDDAKMAEALKSAEAKENSDDQALTDQMKSSEKDAREVNCQGESEIMKDPEGLDYIDDIETNEETAKFVQISSEVKKFNPKKWVRNIKSKFKGLKDKFGKIIDAAAKKLSSLEVLIKKWLGKPIVKALINFFECALVQILTLALKGAANMTALVTGFSVISIVKQGPKFLKMIIDGVKSIRGGFMKKTIKEKYMDYGKGTASFLMVIVLAALGT